MPKRRRQAGPRVTAARVAMPRTVRAGDPLDVRATGAAPCLDAADAAGYLAEEADVIYWGVCPECLSLRT
ncbi:hypothetical protein ABGB17_20110 [Sphaerisporangium sp. B11E5]|uniref:hypothetical protein n=1 Tax=Sphaerisporangium sp. B11E5 TaxID=3153563 RepID=UPI00325F4504